MGVTASSQAVGVNGRARWAGLAFIALAVAMIISSVTITNVAVPQIIGDLGLSSTGAQWVQESYALVFAALLLTFGRLADRLGRRRLLLTGVTLFAVTSLLASAATSGPMLVGARIVQGVGGAMIFPTTLSLLNAGFRGRDRATAFAVWGATIGGMAALGPLVGGWLTTDLSWRWAFGINIPVAVAVVAGVLAFVPESREADTRRGADVIGAVLSTLGFGLLVFGLVEGRVYGWWRAIEPFAVGGWDWPLAISPVPIAFAASALALTAFVLVERARNRRGDVALLDLSLLSITSFRNGNIAALIVSLGEFGVLFALPLWMQFVLGYSPLQTGVALLPLAVGSFAASAFASPLSRSRGPAFVVRLGLLLEIVGIAGLGLVVSADTPWALPVPFLFCYGMGIGLATAQLTGVVLAEVPVERSGQGSGTQSTVRQIGSALGIAVLGTLLFAGLSADLGHRLSQMDGLDPARREQIVSAVQRSAGAAIAGLSRVPQIAVAARESFAVGTRYAAFGAAGFLAVGLLASLSLGGGRVEEDLETDGAGRGREAVIPDRPSS
ncbi:DHA2 family efflux MFS transporter permease subunit [Streptosporangium sp. NPDC051023]|uniref:DHA2 family efflux MFS transporter permease subunit n=1 Tax=Streptosporangium sp. NPDC051023 TaxID=3155410 RepID=UPI00344BAD8E